MQNKDTNNKIQSQVMYFGSPFHIYFMIKLTLLSISGKKILYYDSLEKCFLQNSVVSKNFMQLSAKNKFGFYLPTKFNPQKALSAQAKSRIVKYPIKYLFVFLNKSRIGSRSLASSAKAAILVDKVLSPSFPRFLSCTYLRPLNSMCRIIPLYLSYLNIIQFILTWSQRDLPSRSLRLKAVQQYLMMGNTPLILNYLWISSGRFLRSTLYCFWTAGSRWPLNSTKIYANYTPISSRVQRMRCALPLVLKQTSIGFEPDQYCISYLFHHQIINQTIDKLHCFLLYIYESQAGRGDQIQQQLSYIIQLTHMPLYEMMIIAKCSTPENLASTATYLAKSIWKHGGVVRDVKILTDRILPKQLKSKDGHYVILGRYSQILFDGSPLVMDKARKDAEYDKNIVKVSFFKVQDFYSHAQEYQKNIGSQISSGNIQLDTARKIAALREEGSL